MRVLRPLAAAGGASTYLAETPEGARVLLRRMAVGPAGASLRLRLEHEASLLRACPTLQAGAPASVALEEDAIVIARPFLEGEPLSERLRRGPLPLSEALRVGARVAAGLREAHERGVLHGGVCAANVILTPSGALLVDFGLARPATLEDEKGAALRASYLAPEQCGLLDVPVDERADLYSLGILLFHALAGRRPFERERMRDVLRDQIAARPPELRSGGVRVPRVADELVQRLLRKDPRERYQTAAGVERDLEAMLDALSRGQQEPSLVLGAHDARASLADPAFVVRARQFAALEARLAGAGRGEGGLVLLEAESGGGKTRLLDEFAHHAQAMGALVLRGQGVDQAARQPFQVLRGVAADLARALEEDASFAPLFDSALGEDRDALLLAAPDLREALGGGDAAELGPEAHGERRSIQAFARMLDAAGLPGRPALVILDDCQWADEATVKLLAAWAREESPKGRRAVVIAAFRTEEVDADHPLRAAAASLRMALPPFGREDVARLCESMAGPLPRGAVDAVAELSEGSPFMASAVLRGFVESGALVASPSGWLVDPSRMAEMQSSTQSAAFLARRLRLLPVETLHALTVGAVLGKEFDLAMACELSGQAATRTIPALEVARQRHIVWTRAESGRYAFVHDKLRETLLAMLTEEERERLHRRAAEHLERTLQERAFEIAYHFDAARDAARALPYALRAAEEARRRHSLELAEQHYRIALRGAPPDDAAMIKRVREGLGDVLMLRGRYAEASRCFEEAQRLAESPVARAEILAKAGELAFKRGDMRSASEALEAGLRTLGRTVPRSSLGYAMRAAFEALVQVLHTLLPRLFLARRKREGAEEELIAIRLYSRLAYAYWFQKGLAACGWAHLREMNLAERYPASLELAQAYSEHAPVMTMIPWCSRGIRYARRSLEIRKGFGDIWGQGQSLHFLAVVLYAASRYDECLQHSREAIRLLSKTGDMWEENTARWHVAFCQYRLGDLAAAVATARAVHESATEIGDAQASGIALGIWAKASEGALPAALVEAARETPSEDVHTTAEVLMASALVALKADRPDEAVARLQTAWGLVSGRGLRQEYVAPVLPWLATAMRARLDASARLLPRDRELAHEGLRAARKAVSWARFYRNNLPHALRERAWFEAVLGREAKARALLDESLLAARVQGAAHEMALTMRMRARLARDLGWPRGADEPDEGAAPLAAPAQQPSLALADRYHGVLEAGRRIVAELDAPGIRAAALRGAGELLRTDACALLEVGPEGRVAGDSREARAAQALLEGAPAGRAVTFRADAPGPGAEALLAMGARSAAACLVHVRGSAVLCLYAEQPQVSGAFREEEAAIVEFVAAIAGAALENAEGFAALKSANERLHFQKVLLERQGDAAIDGILVVSPEGRILSSNRRFAEIWKLRDEDLASDETALRAVLHLLEDPEEFLRRVRELYARPDEESREEVRLKDGRVLDRYSAPIFTAEGQARARVWFFRDITSLKSAEARLRETNEQLVQVGNLKTLLLNTASHELNTPLTPMMLQIHLLETGRLGPLAERQQRAVGVLSRNTARLHGLVRDLLDVSRIQSGRLRLEKTRVDLAALLRDTCASFEEAARQAGVSLLLADAPATVVVADPERVTQVLFNLVSNALKFTPAGGRVSLRVEADEAAARIAVEDTGAGLAPEQIARLFQPFTQVHDPMRVTAGGSGLGLYISRGIVEEHGGRIWCESEGAGRGATFRLTLPRE